MSQSENKPKLSDIARQNTADKAKRFSSTMIPSPPPPKPVAEPAPVPVETPAPELLSDVIKQGEADIADGKATTYSADELKKLSPTNSASADKTVPAKTTRARRSGSLSIDEVISGEPPKGEAYPRQVRISESHHKLLRKLAFVHDVTMNHVLHNLLDLLEQADQRDQQKGE